MDLTLLTLSRGARRVYKALTTLVLPSESEVELKGQAIADESGLDVRGVRRGLKELEEHGFIRRLNRPHRPYLIRINRSVMTGPKQAAPAEIPKDQLDKAANVLYVFWAGLWKERYGVRPSFAAEDFDAAREIARSFWMDGPDAAQDHITAKFGELQPPLLIRLK